MDTDNKQVKAWVGQELGEGGQSGKMGDTCHTLNNKINVKNS